MTAYEIIMIFLGSLALLISFSRLTLRCLPFSIRKTSALQEGKLTKQEIKYLKYKDLGECALLAIAITSNEYKVIITNDKGRVHKYP